MYVQNMHNMHLQCILQRKQVHAKTIEVKSLIIIIILWRYYYEYEVLVSIFFNKKD